MDEEREDSEAVIPGQSLSETESKDLLDFMEMDVMRRDSLSKKTLDSSLVNQFIKGVCL